MFKQKLALSRFTVFTWGVTLVKSRVLYSSVVRPAITYAAAIWRSFKDIQQHNKSMNNKLNIMQNSCLRAVIEAYKVTSIKVLKAEFMTKFITNHMNNLQTRTKFRLRFARSQKLIEESCAAINRKLKNKRGRRKEPGPTSGKIKHFWANNILKNSKSAPRAPQVFWK